METKTTIQGLTKNVGNSSASEITEVVKRKPIKGEYLNLKGQVFPKSIQNEILEEIKRQGADNEDFMDSKSDFIWEISAKGYKYWDNLYKNTDYNPAKLKNVTQQKRVELIETQKWELIAATATIDNQAATINDLLARNGNLTRITNDQTERIEVMQHELKNYESAVVSLEGIKDALNKKLDKFEEFNKYLLENETKINESRERLASKFTNWFLFLVTVIIIEAVFLVKMALENGSKP